MNNLQLYISETLALNLLSESYFERASFEEPQITEQLSEWLLEKKHANHGNDWPRSVLKGELCNFHKYLLFETPNVKLRGGSDSDRPI